MDPYYLIYDWNCELCVNLMRFVKQLDRKNAIVFLPMDDPLAKDFARRMAPEAFEDRFHLVLPTQEVLSGDEAIPFVIGALPGGRFPQWILLHFPGKKFLLRSFYRWIVNVRDKRKN
ncbi:MAG: DUF393 domain-containing protein [Chlamydiae bacterium]|nr:DUF393 domain-containing protein [Chlamydiota bacterium]MBI3277624.1 DUF393 domain-containing protein [Chlamydiota bacterium]